MRRVATTRKRNEGVALILTLLFVVLLTVLVVEFAYEAQVEASYSLNSGNDFQARLAARSAVYKGLSVLETDRLQSELGAADGSASPADSRLSSWALPGEFEPLNDAVMRATISDEFGKINLNALVDYSTGEKFVREQVRQALILFFQQRATTGGQNVDAEALVDAIIDWLDEDDEIDGNGAETAFYQAAETPYSCKNGPMDSIDELLLIKGMSPALFFGARDVDPPQLPVTEFLTVHGDWIGRINPNTVYIDLDSGVSDALEAYCLGWVEAGMAEDINFEQMIQDMLSVQEELGAYQNVDDLAGYVTHVELAVAESRRPRGGAQDLEAAQVAAEREVLRQIFTVHSHIFRIHGDAMLDDILIRNEAYVLRVPQDPGTLDWPGGNEALPFQNPVYSGLELPQEFYRILSWKVIQ
ncbi:MAG: general secretion pathway protein GspK [Candidatus Hydrogenedentes bacterium]|nr:general secretion pathway protein GspK [Candidatus Hydrogenedentota bacterium]